ncbi:GMC oxidoreductase [Bradyrhizobium erythrophlei]|uniref:GMC oxidoreductase n=1 Tax=Bradyrhizobium erythrophlei TaxID=1437360 RepID=UPI0035EB3130
MATQHDFVIVGSGAGGGTIAWLLAKAGYNVLLLEQGPDFAAERRDGTKDFDPAVHDEFFYRQRKPDPKRRLRGDYNTFRKRDTAAPGKPFPLGWTGSVVGGGSVLWGTWAFRALPIDFKLKTHFERTGQLAAMTGYSIVDWPIDYSEMLPFFSVAEALLGVSGDRKAVNDSIRQSDWYQRFRNEAYWGSESLWFPEDDYPLGPYTRTPVGQFVFDGIESVAPSWKAFPTPMAIVRPGSGELSTQRALAYSLAKQSGSLPGEFWTAKAEELWSDRVRKACNMCGYCGEYLCWGSSGPKWGTQDTTLREIKYSPNASVQPNAKAIEIVVDDRSGRATGVSYLDLTNRDDPKLAFAPANFVIVSCGAVQTTRLLLMSGPAKGLGNTSGQLGANATFHMFGLGIKATLDKRFQGLLHGELGPTGNTTTFATYFMKEPDSDTWIKGGHLTSSAKKNPLDDAIGALTRQNNPQIGQGLIDEMVANNRRLEVRLTADDLPIRENRVSLDPTYVDEYGVPVAQITRALGPNEDRVNKLGRIYMSKLFDQYRQKGTLDGDLMPSDAILTLIGDHQMGTCRMGDDPAASVVNRFCRLHDAENVFVVDSSFMPTGLGLNPTVTVVANALRVGTHIVDALKKGEAPGRA